jgi:hypothetical protein
MNEVGSRRRRHRRLLALVGVTVLAGAAPAVAHYAYFTGSVYYDVYVPANAERCIVTSSGCSQHSWSFVSAKDIGSSNFICARIRLAGGTYTAHCGDDFVRHCTRGQNHSTNQLDCHDQDSVDNLIAAGFNDEAGTTLQLHGGY